VSGFRQSTTATLRKLTALMEATSNGGKVEMALPTITATPIFAMKATTIPNMIGNVR
jgi:hypothetical protein